MSEQKTAYIIFEPEVREVICQAGYTCEREYEQWYSTNLVVERSWIVLNGHALYAHGTLLTKFHDMDEAMQRLTQVREDIPSEQESVQKTNLRKQWNPFHHDQSDQLKWK